MGQSKYLILVYRTTERTGSTFITKPPVQATSVEEVIARQLAHLLIGFEPIETDAALPHTAIIRRPVFA